MSDKRLFFALWPTERQRESLRELIRPLVGSVEGRAVDRWNWHVTLVFIGGFPEDRISELLAAVSEIRCEPFRVRFDRMTFWARPKIACLQTITVPEELLQLKSGLETALLWFDIQPEAHTYRPHITLARSVRSFDTQSLARPVEMQWSGFELMESVSTTRGVQYRPLKQEVRRDS